MYIYFNRVDLTLRCGRIAFEWEGFEPELFPLKYNPTTFEYKIHFIEVDLYYLKYL